MEQIRVLVANPHPIVRNGLRCLLERDSKIRVIGEAANRREAILLAEYQHPDVAVLDVTLHSVRGIDAVHTIASREPRTRIVILGAVADESYVQEAFHAGALAYVLADDAQTDLLRAVFLVAADRVFMSPAVRCALLDDWNRRGTLQEPAVSERQQRLFSLFFDGLCEAEIAEILMISEAETHSACEDLLQRFSLSKALLCCRAI